MIHLPIEQTELRSLLYQENAVVSEIFNPKGQWEIEASLSNSLKERFSPYLYIPDSEESAEHEADFLVQSE